MKTVTHAKKGLGALTRYIIESVLYLKHKLTKTSYAQYYAERMDIQIRLNPNWGLNLKKEFQVNFLKSNQFINPNTKFLDYGCGALSAGVHFIEYLEVGKYLGVDVSQEVLREGLRRLAGNGLSYKKARLIHIPSGDLQPIMEEKYDVIWAQSVLTHMPPVDVEKLLLTIPKLLRGEGVFYATFTLTDDEPKQKRFKDWFYSVSYLRLVASNAGLEFDIVEQWKHPEDLVGIDKLAKFKAVD